MQLVMSGSTTFAARRVEAGFSVADVAEEFGVLPELVCEWDEGRAQPPAHIVRSLETIGRIGASERPSGIKPPQAEFDAIRDEGPLFTPDKLIKSKKRVADHGEVFTPPWLVKKMLDLVKGETERIDSRFLEPACGSGNFLVPILQRKLAAVELKYGKSDFEKRHYALVGLTCCYGIELLADNITECRANMLEVFAAYLKLEEADELYRAAEHVLSLNLIHGDAMTMRDHAGDPILVVEWGYMGKGKFQRRDFRLDRLTGMAAFREEGTLFAGLGRHEIFQPTPDRYPPMTVRELSSLGENETIQTGWAE
jgi:transcriptional regulator with XRE-family HTH domain